MRAGTFFKKSLLFPSAWNNVAEFRRFCWVKTRISVSPGDGWCRQRYHRRNPSFTTSPPLREVGCPGSMREGLGAQALWWIPLLSLMPVGPPVSMKVLVVLCPGAAVRVGLIRAGTGRVPGHEQPLGMSLLLLLLLLLPHLL